VGCGSGALDNHGPECEHPPNISGVAMTRKLATRAVKDELETLKQGLHIAMDHLINRKDYHEAEVVLRQLDIRLVQLINDIQVSE
jgi:hypothetical protein